MHDKRKQRRISQDLNTKKKLFKYNQQKETDLKIKTEGVNSEKDSVQPTIKNYDIKDLVPDSARETKS